MNARDDPSAQYPDPDFARGVLCAHGRLKLLHHTSGSIIAANRSLLRSCQPGALDEGEGARSATVRRADDFIIEYMEIGGGVEIGPGRDIRETQALHVTWIEHVHPESVAHVFREILADPRKRREMPRRAQQPITGGGGGVEAAARLVLDVGKRYMNGTRFSPVGV